MAATIEVDKFREAGRIAGTVREFGKAMIQPGARLADIVQACDDKIREMGGEPAFPAQLSRNHIAAHYCPAPDDPQLVEDGDILKLDLGAHVDGYVADNAVTVDLRDGNDSPLCMASKMALENVVANVGPGVIVSELGRIVHDTITALGFKPVYNLTGHGVARYQVHCKPQIPNYDDKKSIRLRPGQVIAVEPFASDGKGYIDEVGKAEVFQLRPAAQEEGQARPAHRGLPPGDASPALRPAGPAPALLHRGRRARARSAAQEAPDLRVSAPRGERGRADQPTRAHDHDHRERRRSNDAARALKPVPGLRRRTTLMSERAKIGIDIREAVRAHPRGIGVYQGHVVEALGQQDAPYDYVLYHERPRESQWPEIPANARTSRLEMKGSRFHLWERFGLPVRLLGDGIKVYHGTFNTLPPRPWPLRGPKLVVTIHDLIVTWLDENLDDPYVRYVRKVMGRVVKQSDAIVTISEFSKRDIVMRYKARPETVHVVHNGLHPRFYEDPPQEELDRVRTGFADGKPYLLAVGALLSRKNCDALFPMLAALKADGTLGDAILVMTGLEGEALELRKRAAEAAGVLEHVRFHGYLDWADLHALFAGAELFVYPSLYEGWGIPIVEALACGTPVATSKTTSMPEAGGDFARYFDPKDAESIRETVRSLWNERSAWRERRAEAQSFARGFSYDEHARRLTEIYGELLG